MRTLERRRKINILTTLTHRPVIGIHSFTCIFVTLAHSNFCTCSSDVEGFDESGSDHSS